MAYGEQQLVATNDRWLAGVDGYLSGWVIALVRPAGEEVRVRTVPHFAGLLALPERPSIIAIDIPIGLPARSGGGARMAESTVRPLLGDRQSSLFSVPARAAIYASDYREACRLAVEQSDPPRKVSKQLYLIAPKIREVDACLRTDPGLAQRVFEVHPELAFWRLNGERALTVPKKLKRRYYEPGLTLRRHLLIKAGFVAAAVAADPPKGAGADDLLDALACAAMARRLHAGIARPFPDPPQRDAFGLPMAIWA